jgi:hypothetical protein
MSKRKPPPVAPLPEKLLHKLAKPVPERLRKLVASVPEKLHDWIDSLAERELRAIALQFAQPNDLTPAQRPVRRRRPGAGAPRRLTPEEITEGRELLRRALRKHPTLRKRKSRADMLELLQRWLKRKRMVKTKRNVVSEDTLVRHIVGPVLGRPRRSPRSRR